MTANWIQMIMMMMMGDDDDDDDDDNDEYDDRIPTLAVSDK